MKNFFSISQSIVLLGILFLIFPSCHNEPDSVTESFSYRDGVYSGSQLTVTLDGKNVTSVRSVTLSSKLLDTNLSPDKDPDQFVHPSNPTYTTIVTIDGFPTSKESSSFTTVSDLMGFKGDTDIKGVEYKYDAEFTGDPLLHHANQGLILRFAKQ